MDICMQVGHMNASMGDAWLKPMTGAPEEEPKNQAITFRCAEILRLRKINVTVTDANGYKDTTIINRDWDLFLAVHCDADSAALSAGFTDYADPATDGATQKSQAMADKIAFKFFPEAGITYRPERRGNLNVRFYYFWQYLSTMTPCVLIEMGESVDPHDKVILQDTERCAIALARGVCEALGVAYDLPILPVPPVEPSQPPVIPPTTNWEQKYNDEVTAHEITKKSLETYLANIDSVVKDAVDAATKPLSDKIEAIRLITFGKGWWWVRLNDIKKLFS